MVFKMAATAPLFLEQLTTQNYFLAVFYIIATIGVLLGAMAVICIDGGLVAPENLVKTVTQKVVSFFVSAVSFSAIGYAVWNWQYYQGLGVENSFLISVNDWSLLGSKINFAAQYIDPKEVGSADMSQIFFAFFFCFAGLCAVLIQGAGLERLKDSACYWMSAVVGAVLVPVIAYLLYGSASPLTNAGVHDFVGASSLYLVVGIWGLLLAWRLGHRKGDAHPPGNFVLLWLGVLLLMLAIPMFVIGCGFLIPGMGYFGPTLASTGLGLVFNNIFMAMGGGAVCGALIAKKTENHSYILLGPIAGYIACSAIYDVAVPWQAGICGFAGPMLLVLGEMLVKKIGLDEPKVAPLTVLPAVFSILAAGIVGAGAKQGGVIGVEQGEFTFQHATVGMSMQLYGLVIVVVVTTALAAATIFLIEKCIGLRESETVERDEPEAFPSSI